MSPKATIVLDRPRIIAEPSSIRGADEVLSEAALEFLAELHERFDNRRRALLDQRLERQARFDAGELPDFPEETRDIREAEWTVGPIPRDLLRQGPNALRIEVTGTDNPPPLFDDLGILQIALEFRD